MNKMNIRRKPLRSIRKGPHPITRLTDKTLEDVQNLSVGGSVSNLRVIERFGALPVEDIVKKNRRTAHIHPRHKRVVSEQVRTA